MYASLDAAPWAVGIILLPLVGAILCFIWPRRANLIGMIAAGGIAAGGIGLLRQILAEGPVLYAVGGWGAPLGIDLYADGLSLLMLLMTATVGLAVSVYGIGYFGSSERERVGFWPLWLFLWGTLNALFLSRDVFNLYVTLELLGLSSVALVALAGGPAALSGAMRYLLLSLLGSLAYLLAVALLYHAYGTVDMALLSSRIMPGPAAWAAIGLMTTGLVLKTALFPLHFWLPPAHANAPGPVSAVLSALVVKASFYLLLRLWLEVFPLGTEILGQMLGTLGAAAIVWGSFQALRQVRLKLLIAYSTVAQLGYLFLPFALSATVAASQAWRSGVYLAVSHALAKAAMFLCAGNILRFGGHDRIAELDRVAQRLPFTVAAFGIAGVTIMGLPPSGGFIAKWLMLEAALNAGQWWWAPVIIVGGLLAAGYVFKVVGFAFTEASYKREARAVPHTMEWAAMLLALGSLVLGLTAPQPLEWLQIGEPLRARSVP